MLLFHMPSSLDVSFLLGSLNSHSLASLCTLRVRIAFRFFPSPASTCQNGIERSFRPWIPEDDLLLKNALEAGASLEALAKGAIRFSRQYTIPELQSRWHALLYDPDTSEPASAHMVELELSAQSNRHADYKKNGVSGKRKYETVRSHYYAMRKRVCSEPFCNVNLSVFEGPTFCSSQEQVNSHNDHPVQNCNIEDSVVDHFDLHNTNFGTASRAFPQVKGANISATCSAEADTHAFHNQQSLKDEISDRILGVEDMGLPQELPGGIIFGPAKLLGKFDAVDNNPVSICPGFRQSTGFTDCAATVHQLEYSSPGLMEPIWRTMEDVPTPSSLNNVNLDDRNKGKVEAMVCPGADDKQVSRGYNVLVSDPQLEERTSDDGFKTSGAVDGVFFELETSLFSFTDEVLFMDDEDEKDKIDRSCLDGLSSILLSSPSDLQQDDMPHIAEHTASFPREAGLIIPDVACPGELGFSNDKLDRGNKGCEQNASVLLSMLVPDRHSPELRNGVICCTLNTEDPDIPCNDDAFLPAQVLPPFVSLEAHHNLEKDGISFLPSSVDLSCSGIDTGQGLNPAKEEEFDASGLIEPQFLQAISPNNRITFPVSSELPGGVSLDLTSRHIISVEGDPRQCGSAHITPCSISGGEMNGKVELEKFHKYDSSMEFLLESSVQCSDQNENDPQKIFSDHKQEPDMSGALENHLAGEHGSFEKPVSEPGNPSTLDKEVQPSEDDNDVPHFFDVEALILDMELGPCDQDSYIEVSRYQHEEAKKTILRLEQGAYSYMQRAISSRRAFAILYGRRLKHYIRKHKVSLGRATNSIGVDIDLAKEGRANGISRRQAIIKMEDNGSFSLKNLGRNSMIVNGKEVLMGHCIKLGSGCLIEIRSLSFIFEVNQKVVKRYLADLAKKD